MSDIISKRLQTGTGPIGIKGIKPISGKFKPRKCVKTVSYRGRPRYICPASGGEQAVHSLESLPVKPEDVAQKLQEVKTLAPEEQYTPKQQRENPEKIQEALFRKPKTIHYDTPHEAGPDLTHDHMHFHEPEEAKSKESDAVTAKDVKDASPKKKKKEKDEDVSKSLYLDSDVYFGDLSKGDGEWKFYKKGPAPTKLRAGDKMSLGPTLPDPRFPKREQHREAEREWYRDKASEKRAGAAGDFALTFLGGGGVAKVGAAGASRLAALIKNAGGRVVTATKGAKLGDRIKGGILVGFIRASTAAIDPKMIIAEHKIADKIVSVAKNYTSKGGPKIAQGGPKVSVSTTAREGARTGAAKRVTAKTPKTTAPKEGTKASTRVGDATKATATATTVAREATKRISTQTQQTQSEGGPSKPGSKPESKPESKPKKRGKKKPSRLAPLLLLPLLGDDEDNKRSSERGERRVGGKRPALSRRGDSGEKSGRSERAKTLRRARKEHDKAKRGEGQYSQVGRKRKFSAHRAESEARGRRLEKSKSFVAPFARQVLNKKTSLKDALDRVPWWMQDDLLEHVRHGKKKK